MSVKENDVSQNDISEESGHDAAVSTFDTQEKPKYENAAELTNFDKGEGPGWFSRKNVMLVISFTLVFIVIFGFAFSVNKSKKKKADDAYGRAARTPKEFLNSELENSLIREQESPELAELELEPESGLPEVTPVSYTENRTAELRRGDAPPAPPPAPSGYGNGGSSGGGGGGGYRAPPFTAHRSSLVPAVEGSLFPGSGASKQSSAGTYAEKYPYMEAGAGAAGYPAAGYPPGAASGIPMGGAMQDPYAAQNNQADKKSFYDSGYASGGITGTYIGNDSLWVGSIIPAVLETAVNTDLPGNVLARVSQNIYDSRTGKKLLIPQGSVLVAKYNSSVSYAQRRVQIVWDLLIRPDGVTASNAEFVNQVGGNIVSRAMNVQPTLTIENGEKVNVMLNRNVYLPPAENIDVTQKYILK